MEKFEGLNSFYDTKLFDGLSTLDVNALFEECRINHRNFDAGEILWREGAIAEELAVLEQGTLYCRRYHPDGKTQIVRIYTPPTLLNLEALVSRKQSIPTFIEAQTGGIYHWIAYETLFENPKIDTKIICTIQQNILRLLADDSIKFMNRSDILSRRRARDRIRMYFNILREKQGAQIHTNMTQEALANYLCIDRSTLSEELNRMRREGLIDYHNGGSFFVNV